MNFSNVYVMIIIVIICLLLSTNTNVSIDRSIHTAIDLPCRSSTISNPMSNILPYSEDPTIKACIDSNEIKNDNLFNGFLRVQDDNINDETSFPFITLPDTSIYGTKPEFAQYLMGDFEPQCKSDGNGCETYRDVRFRF